MSGGLAGRAVFLAFFVAIFCTISFLPSVFAVPNLTVTDPANDSFYEQVSLDVPLNYTNSSDTQSVWYVLNGGNSTILTGNTSITGRYGKNYLYVLANDSGGNTRIVYLEFQIFDCGVTFDIGTSSDWIELELNHDWWCNTTYAVTFQGYNKLIGNGYALNGSDRSIQIGLHYTPATGSHIFLENVTIWNGIKFNGNWNQYMSNITLRNIVWYTNGHGTGSGSIGYVGSGVKSWWENVTVYGALGCSSLESHNIEVDNFYIDSRNVSGTTALNLGGGNYFNINNGTVYGGIIGGSGGNYYNVSIDGLGGEYCLKKGSSSNSFIDGNMTNCYFGYKSARDNTLNFYFERSFVNSTIGANGYDDFYGFRWIQPFVRYNTFGSGNILAIWRPSSDQTCYYNGNVQDGKNVYVKIYGHVNYMQTCDDAYDINNASQLILGAGCNWDRLYGGYVANATFKTLSLQDGAYGHNITNVTMDYFYGIRYGDNLIGNSFVNEYIYLEDGQGNLTFLNVTAPVINNTDNNSQYYRKWNVIYKVIDENGNPLTANVSLSDRFGTQRYSKIASSDTTPQPEYYDNQGSLTYYGPYTIVASKPGYTSDAQTFNLTGDAHVVLQLAKISDVIFIEPTPSNGSTIYVNHVYVNASVSENVSNCLLVYEQDGTSGNNTMYFVNANENTYCYLNKTGLRRGTFAFKVYANDTRGNRAVTETRWIYISVNTPPAQSNPILNSTSGNNFTTDNLTCYNQSTYDADNDPVINIYNWYRNGQPLTLLNLPFEGGSNSTWTKDYSGHGNDGMISGANWGRNTGKIGGAYQFDGADDYIKATKNFGTSFNTFSAEAWVNLKTIGTQYRYILERDDTHFYVAVSPDRKIRFRHVDLTSGSTETGPNAIEFNEWTHIAAVYDGTKTYVYVNGQLEKEQADNGTISLSLTKPLYIGSSQYAPSYPDRTWNGTIDEVKIYDKALTPQQVRQNYLDTKDGHTSSRTIVSQETAGGETYKCEVTPNDGFEDGETKESNDLTILWNITFNIYSGETGESLTNVNIYCNNSWSVTGVNSPYSHGFLPGDYSCTFERTNYFDQTKVFTADSDKIVDVKMSLAGKMTEEEHDWLEWLYNCWKTGECRQTLNNIYQTVTVINQTTVDINQTVSEIWDQFKQTDESIVLLENKTSSIVSNTSNISIDYSLSVPVKEDYEFLPIRIFYWFLDETNATCFNQAKKPDNAENPFCNPLIAHTIGEVNTVINFTVDLRPSLPAGNYTIVRRIDIDPANIWINYGHEIIGRIEVLEANNKSGINLQLAEKQSTLAFEPEKTEEYKTHDVTGTLIKEIVPWIQGLALLVTILIILVVFAIKKKLQVLRLK